MTADPSFGRPSLPASGLETKTIELGELTESAKDNRAFTTARAERLIADIQTYFSESEENARVLVASVPADDNILTLRRKSPYSTDYMVHWSRPSGHGWKERDMSAHMDSADLLSYGHIVPLDLDNQGLVLFALAPNTLQDPTEGADRRWNVAVSLMAPNGESGRSYTSVGPTVVLSFKDTAKPLHTRGLMSAIADTMDPSLVEPAMDFPDGPEEKIDLAEALEAVLSESLVAW